MFSNTIRRIKRPRTRYPMLRAIRTRNNTIVGGVPHHCLPFPLGYPTRLILSTRHSSWLTGPRLRGTNVNAKHTRCENINEQTHTCRCHNNRRRKNAGTRVGQTNGWRKNLRRHLLQLIHLGGVDSGRARWSHVVLSIFGTTLRSRVQLVNL